MAAATFLNLPGELRNQIWDDAANARPANAGGVHRFSIFYTHNIPDQFKNHTVVTRANAFDTALGPPFAANAANPDPWNDPQSTYSIDAGLWTACRESRAAMLRRHGNEPSSMTLRVGNNGGGDRYITIDTERDLVLLDIRNMAVGEPLHFRAVFATCDRFSRDQSLRDRFSLLRRIRHVGLDFDPTWVYSELSTCVYAVGPPCHGGPKSSDEPSFRMEAYRALILIHEWCKHSTRSFWLVDRGRECYRPSAPDGAGTVPSFQGSGCRYTLAKARPLPRNWWEITPSATIVGTLCGHDAPSCYRSDVQLGVHGLLACEEENSVRV
ncbi:hypothetical protein CMUS01_05576 [Colletotrichum musicola]|uniref:2EXR domain-containing protein n=1 Tax=Colletotrichum musicola TaxID=2175873 RepID=A0A8H6NKN8_9PEZI|nr:hypothetical protein CMUS01_05576 [Colletotrichum musicola]